jgi:hypothetical protein
LNGIPASFLIYRRIGGGEGQNAPQIAMTLAQWFTQYEHGGFPIEKAALGSCDLSQSCMSAANGNGSFAAMAVIWRKVRRVRI